MMVQTDLIREDRTVATLHSLNEAAVQRSATTRMLTFDTRVNGRPLSRYPADGIMVSTPTGSTGSRRSRRSPASSTRGAPSRSR
jgi:NAD+ kinase